MICPNCGSENKDTAKFCNECGSSFVQETVPVSADPDQDAGSIPADPDQDFGSIPADPRVTVPFSSLPEIDPLDDAPVEDSDDMDFDFSPITPPSENSYVDTRGIDEYLVSPDYVAPSWKSGGTMELPRVEGEEAPRNIEFRAPEAPKKSGGKKVAIAIVLIVLIAALGTGGITYYLEMWGGKSLPDVVGLDQAEATKVLEEKRFVAKTMQVKSDDTEGIVLLMDPGAGKRLSQGSEVVLQVAVSRSVPEVAGLSKADAEKAFNQEGLQRITYVEEKSDAAEGSILSVEPAAGTTCTASTPITVRVAKPYSVPDVAGKDEASAVQLLNDEGYEAYSTWVYSEEPEGTVIGSDPAAGTVLASGSTVTLQIAKSRATELVNATYDFLGGYVGSTLEIGGTAYELVSVDGVNYEGDNKTTATVTVVGVTTLPDGEVVRGSQKQRTVTFAWNDDNSIASYA